MARRYLRWAKYGQVFAELTIVVDIGCLEPAPCLRMTGSAFGRRIDQRLEIVTQRQRLGGERFYVLCPITGRRCLALALPPGRSEFASIPGWRVRYSCQREQKLDRALRAIDKLEKQQGLLSKYTRWPRRDRLTVRIWKAHEAINSEGRRLVGGD